MCRFSLVFNCLRQEAVCHQDKSRIGNGHSCMEVFVPSVHPTSMPTHCRISSRKRRCIDQAQAVESSSYDPKALEFVSDAGE